jgi:tRNA dimethylallyltransferase
MGHANDRQVKERETKDRPAKRAVLIAGPTASGKSALALALAEKLGGIVINADSMQVYRDLHVITARPGEDEEARVPHRLYGHVDAVENYSVGQWLGDAAAALSEADASARVPIIVGGTGLYFKLLTRGLAAVPPIPPEIRNGIRGRLAQEGPQALHAELQQCDPISASRLMPADGVRIARALEVMAATGRSLPEWHRSGMPPLVDPAHAVRIFLAPDRPELYRRIDARFAAMIAAGALEEVRALDARGLDPLLPAMKAHGVPWLRRHLAGEITLADAVGEAKKDTRHYSKRQLTWFRNQMPGWTWVTSEQAMQIVERLLADPLPDLSS